MSDIFSGAKLVVVKVGSALLVDGAKGELRRDWLASLCDDIADLKKKGQALPLLDGMIASTALTHDLTVATHNLRDFKRAGVKVFDPFE